MRGEKDHFHGILYISEVEFVTWVWVPTTSDILTASFPLEIYINEMVSTGDTEISLHIRSPRASWVGRGALWSQNWKYSKCQDLLKFQFSGGGGPYSGVTTENTRSAKICLNFNFRGRGGTLWSEIPKRGSLENLVTNLLCVQKPACASQIVAHMWRLIKFGTSGWRKSLLVRTQTHPRNCSSEAN